MEIINKRDGVVVASDVRAANGLIAKVIGLLGKGSISDEYGLLFYGAGQIHTFFMRFSIDVMFMDKDRKIIKIYHELVPFRVTGFFIKSYNGYVLELKSGLARIKSLKLGDMLEW